MLVALESLARQEGAKRLVCNAREDAIAFYEKNGFERRGELTDERGPVRHQQMVKQLDPMADVLRRQIGVPSCNNVGRHRSRLRTKWASKSTNTLVISLNAARSSTLT